MILPQTDHAMILIAAVSLLTQAENAFVTSHDVTIVPFGDAVEVAQSARATSATIATSGMLGLLSPTPTMTDASKSALFPHCHRIDAAFSVLSSMRSCKLATTKKEMCR
jgi:hypothetical protein